MASTELVPTNGALPTADDFARAGVALGELAERRDVEGLYGAAVEADAYRHLFQQREGHRATANQFARLKVTAEALIGEVDLMENGHRAINASALLHVDGREIAGAEAKYWRCLGAAHMRGALDSILDEIETKGEDISTVAAYTAASRRGAFWVPRGALRDSFLKSGRSVNELALTNGFGYSTVSALVGAKGQDQRSKVSYTAAIPVAIALGVDPRALPMARHRPARRRPKRLWIRRQRKLTGGRWDEVYSRFRRCLDEFAQVAGEDQYWDEAYEHFYALERTIANAMKRDALVK